MIIAILFSLIKTRFSFLKHLQSILSCNKFPINHTFAEIFIRCLFADLEYT